MEKCRDKPRNGRKRRVDAVFTVINIISEKRRPSTRPFRRYSHCFFDYRRRFLKIKSGLFLPGRADF
jgi:hypothetical protein